MNIDTEFIECFGRHFIRLHIAKYENHSATFGVCFVI